MTTKTQKKKLQKKKNHAFGKDIYLIGKDEQGINYWLESPSWDCGWYWGFGYIETYTNNRNPSMSKDIASHSHWSGLVGEQERYDYEKGCFVKGEYIHHINQTDLITPFTEKESWELSDLVQTYYTLNKTAELYKHGNSYLTSTKIDKSISDQELVAMINKIQLPKVFKRIIEILEPTEELG